MKFMIGSILAKLLDKMGFSVVIGCEADGEIRVNRNNQLYYNNDLSKAKLYYPNGQEFEIPEGKFTIKSTLNEENNKYIEWYRKVINKKST